MSGQFTTHVRFDHQVAEVLRPVVGRDVDRGSGRRIDEKRCPSPGRSALPSRLAATVITVRMT